MSSRQTNYWVSAIQVKTLHPGLIITEQRADALLSQDVSWAEDSVNDLVRVPLTNNQFSALVSFVFNVGVAAFETSTLLRVLNAKDYQEAANQLLRWTKTKKSKGKVVSGLMRRRQAERGLFNN